MENHPLYNRITAEHRFLIGGAKVHFQADEVVAELPELMHLRMQNELRDAGLMSLTLSIHGTGQSKATLNMQFGFKRGIQFYTYWLDDLNGNREEQFILFRALVIVAGNLTMHHYAEPWKMFDGALQRHTNAQNIRDMLNLHSDWDREDRELEKPMRRLM